MPTETFIWTILPRGRKENRLRFSILISPRLEPSGKLGDFAVGNWAERMAKLSLAVEFAGGPTLPVKIDTSRLLPEAWKNLFPDSFPVRGHQLPNTATRELKSFPVARLHQYIRGLYAAVASDPASVTSFPSLKDGPVGQLINTVGRLDEIICGVVDRPQTNAFASVPQSPLMCRPQDEKTILRQLGDGVQKDFFQAWRFYNRGNQQPVAHHGEPLPPIPPLVEVPKFDFHDACGMLGDHPQVMRMLGLVLDAEVVLSERNVPVPNKSRIAVRNLEVPGASSSTTHETPWTHYSLESSDFQAVPKGGQASDLVNGFLRLGKKGAFEVMQVDLDGAALNVMSFATNQRRFQRKAAIDALPVNDKCAPVSPIAPDRGSLPSLQTGGITIARNQRKERVQLRLADGVSANTLMSDAAFYADDLLRGYRLDVEYDGKWYSLCRRVAKYDVPGLDSFHVTDEGYVKGSAVSSNPDGDPTNELYLHESLFGWSGWSLVASRPGRVLSREVDTTTRKQVAKVTEGPVRNVPHADVPLKLEPEIKAEPKTLPRLRFGRKYRFRARAVDLAGNSLSHDFEPGSPADTVSESIVYVRFEPVAPPALVHRTPITLGEQLETMVIRTRVGGVPDPLLPPAFFNSLNERHLVPPKTSQGAVESHGLLDAMDPLASYNLSTKEYGTLQDRQIIDENTGATVDVSGSMELLATPEYEPAMGEPPLAWPDPGLPLKKAQYVAHTGDEIRIPYLPDPVALGASLWGTHRGVPVKALAKYEGGYPSLKTLRLALKSGAAVALGSVSGNEIPAAMPPGSILKLRFSTLPDPARIEQFAIWSDMTAAARAAMKSTVEQGQHWMMTPFRELTLVHAVERPVTAPELLIGAINEAGKEEGQTFSRLAGRIKNHSGSTGEAEIAASWTEWEDLLDENPAGVTTSPRKGHVTDLRIAYGDDLRTFPDNCSEPPRHDFGDTKHRRIKYNAVGTTRFLEHFPAEVAKRKDLITLAGPDADEVNILSTARPAAPRVLYIVPTFRWETTPDGKTQKRVGRGLRIYLDRPWYGTGEGERLAAIIGPDRPLATTFVPPPLSESLRRYLSEWGSDPVTSGPVANVNVDLEPGHFTNPDKLVMAGLTLDELGDDPVQTVRAVGFNVGYNAERQLWYCDLEMDPGKAYYPYVRLALARLQPDSIPNAHISRVVRTEFAQLVADRTATINRRSDGFIDLVVWGVSASTDLGTRLPPRPLPVIGPIRGDVIAPNTPVRANAVGDVAAAVEVSPGTIALPFPLIGPVRNPAAGAGHSVRAQLEWRPAGSPSDLAWQAQGGEIELASHTYLLSPGEVFWMGAMPSPSAPGEGVEYRIVLREFELFDTDRQVADSDSPVYNPRRAPLGERLVYLDMFPLT